MLVLTRFRVSPEDHEAVAAFREQVATALDVLAAQAGYCSGVIGRNVDDPSLWVLQTQWDGPGAYRRALSAYDVKLHAHALLGQAIDEPGAYELVSEDGDLNEFGARSLG